MKDILLQLYDGEISPAESMRPECDIAKKQWREFTELDNKFCSQLSESQQKEFDKLLDKKLEMLVDVDMAQAFVDGFRLGAKMMVRVFAEEEI